MSNEPSNSTHRSPNPGVEGEMHGADPAFRRRMFVLLAACLLGAVLVVLLLPGWLDELRQHGSDSGGLDELLRIGFTAVALVMIAPMLLLARLSLRWAGQIRQADSFPTRDMKTTRDVPVRHGKDALRVARWHTAGAIALLWLSVALMAWVAWIWLD